MRLRECRCVKRMRLLISWYGWRGWWRLSSRIRWQIFHKVFLFLLTAGTEFVDFALELCKQLRQVIVELKYMNGILLQAQRIKCQRRIQWLTLTSATSVSRVGENNKWIKIYFVSLAADHTIVTTLHKLRRNLQFKKLQKGEKRQKEEEPQKADPPLQQKLQPNRLITQ